MSTKVDLTLVEVSVKHHAILKKIADNTGIKIKRLAMDLIVAGLKSDYFANKVACSGVKEEIEEINK